MSSFSSEGGVICLRTFIFTSASQCLVPMLPLLHCNPRACVCVCVMDVCGLTFSEVSASTKKKGDYSFNLSLLTTCESSSWLVTLELLWSPGLDCFILPLIKKKKSLILSCRSHIYHEVTITVMHHINVILALLVWELES